MTSKKRNRKGGEYVGPYLLSDGTKQYRILYRVRNPENGRLEQKQKRGFRTQMEASEALKKIQGAKADGSYVMRNTQTVKEFGIVWLAGHSVKPSTLDSYSKNLRLHVYPTLGDIPLQRLTTTQVDALYRHLEREGRHDGNGGLSLTTVRYVHTILRKLLARAVEDRVIPFNPADRAHPPRQKTVKAHAPQRQVWNAGEISRFLRSQADHRLHALWVLFATTGMRRGEALGLRWKDLDLEQERLTIHRTVGKVGGKLHISTPKGGKPRTIDLDPGTVEVLKAHKKRQAAERLRLGERWVDQDLVFAHDGHMLGPGAKAGGFLNPEHMWRLLKTQIRAYNSEPGLHESQVLPLITIHELRHSWATMAMENGVSPNVVQERLGHATVSITLDLYSHVTPTMQKEAAAQVAGRLSLG